MFSWWYHQTHPNSELFEQWWFKCKLVLIHWSQKPWQSKCRVTAQPSESAAVLCLAISFINHTYPWCVGNACLPPRVCFNLTYMEQDRHKCKSTCVSNSYDASRQRQELQYFAVPCWRAARCNRKKKHFVKAEIWGLSVGKVQLLYFVLHCTVPESSVSGTSWA